MRKSLSVKGLQQLMYKCEETLLECPWQTCSVVQFTNKEFSDSDDLLIMGNSFISEHVDLKIYHANLGIS